MKYINKILILALTGVIVSCGSGNNNKELKPSFSEASNMTNEGNAIDQTNPTLMVFPSDALLKRLGCLKEVQNQGLTSYQRNYNNAFIKDSELKFVIATIEEHFSTIGYPLENLEQQLKQITNEKAMDMIEDISKEPRTMLLNTTRPDFIIEIDYEYKQDPMSRNPKKILNYIITVLDVYTNKSVSSISRADIGKNNENITMISLLKEDLNNNISGIHQQIKNRFADQLANGIEISLRLTTDNTDFNFSDECLGDENYNDWINNWLKKHTVNSAFKPVMNTNKEMRFTNVRIKPKTENGQRFTAYDFANELKKDFSKGCGVSCVNKTQGIGDAYIVLTGLK